MSRMGHFTVAPDNVRGNVETKKRALKAVLNLLCGQRLEMPLQGTLTSKPNPRALPGATMKQAFQAFGIGENDFLEWTQC